MNQTPITPPRSDFETRLTSWLEDGPTSGPDELLSRTFARARSTPQHRTWSHRLNHPTRSSLMNSALKFAAVAAIALAVGIGIGPLLTSGPDDASAPGSDPSPSATVKALDSRLGAGTYVATPFAGPGSSGVCEEPPQAGCVETASDDAISFTFDVPDGWSGVPPDGISSGAGTGVLFQRGGGLYDDPCASDGTPQIAVGPTVDDFTNAVASHPLLDVSDPVDVELGGYSGKYLELLVPEDLTGCAQFRPWYPWYYAQTPGERWHLWVLDVGGVRVVVQGIDHADTTPDREAELMAIVDSMRIEGAPVALRQGPLRAGTYVSTPLAPPDGASDCVGQDGCTETVTGDDIAFTFTVPDGWAGAPFDSLWLAAETRLGACRRGPLHRARWLVA